MKYWSIPALLIIVAFVYYPNLKLADPPEELGQVGWIRDFDKGLDKAAVANKPIFLLFQEVPGCMTCQRYGQQVLSHPLIVDAIETYFVPVAIFNNKGGKDAQVLDYYNEPSWNNPVVRIVDHNKLDIMPRLSGNYTPFGVVQQIVFTLERRGEKVPAYLELLYQELKAKAAGTEQATLSMYCFWTGEKQYGQLDGVVDTKAGFMDGREVVQVTYDPAAISFEEVVRNGKQARCADRVYAHDEAQAEAATTVVADGAVSKKSSFRLDRQPKYYLSKTHYRAVPMTATQAARANALIGSGRSPERVLSPRQNALAKKYEQLPEAKWENRIGENIEKAWEW